MNKIKEQFKKDFEESNKKVDLTFDVSKLQLNEESEVTFEEIKRKKKNKRRIIIFSTVSAVTVLTVVGISLSQMLEINTSVTTMKRNLSLNTVAIAESNTFKKLNSFSYPENSYGIRNKVTDSAVSAYNNFTNETYHSLVDTSKKDNMSYASIGLYSIMNELYGAISREDLKNQFDNLLGLNENTRKSFYKSVMEANSFINEDNTTQLKNAAFFNTVFNHSKEYVDNLTQLYCEAYKIDFKTEANKMVEWVNKAVYSDGFIDEQFLNMSEYTQLYYLSTLYFKNAWKEKYLSEDNIDDDFFLSNGSKKTVKYMKHSYMCEEYYDYESYISIRDYYMNGNASITYIVPKKIDDDIFALTKNKNIFEDKIENRVKVDPGADYYRAVLVNLQTPKFKVDIELDLKNTLINLGFADMFNDQIDSFSKAFDDPSAPNYNFYLAQMKQKNEVEFNEDGTIVKSVSFGSVEAKDTSMGPPGDEIDVKLNQPFIYIVRDCNDVPILVGHIDNPQ
ncbi:MAG: hypothetical protein K6E21_05170 [Bacilli bacterium]|nr:hypothetical protein [Bacilli bacterium]